MNCRQFEPLIALYAGHDLDDPTQVESHLAECPECRQLLEDLQSSQAELREWAADSVDAAFLAEVRSAVLAHVEPPRTRVWPWAAVFATAAALALTFVPTQPEPPAPPPPPLVAQAPLVEVQARRSAPTRRKRVVKRNAEPLVVKMLTDDPDIVVIWLVDQIGD